jgi:hypothetical protein
MEGREGMKYEDVWIILHETQFSYFREREYSQRMKRIKKLEENLK